MRQLSVVWRPFGGNPGEFERKARFGEESRCDVQNVEALLSWCLGEHRPKAAEHLGVHHNTIRNWATRGELPMHRNPANGYRLFKKSTWTGSLRSSPSQKQRLRVNPNRNPIGE
jgi:hypothetical protein